MKIQLRQRNKSAAIDTTAWDGIAGENGIAANGFRVSTGVMAGAAEWQCHQEKQKNWTGKKTRNCMVCDKHDESGNPIADETTVTCGDFMRN